MMVWMYSSLWGDCMKTAITSSKNLWMCSEESCLAISMRSISFVFTCLPLSFTYISIFCTNFFRFVSLYIHLGQSASMSLSPKGKCQTVTSICPKTRPLENSARLVSFLCQQGGKVEAKARRACSTSVWQFILFLYDVFCIQLYRYQMPRLLQLVTLLGLVALATSVTKISHRAQLAHCLNICHQPITVCINLRHDRCLNTYHTCLTKAKDFYRCANSSKIKQMKSLALCIQKKCQEVPEEDYELALLQNPYRTMHRKLPLCSPWLVHRKELFFGRLEAPEEMYNQSQRFLCQFNKKKEKKQQQKHDGPRYDKNGKRYLPQSAKQQKGANKGGSCGAMGVNRWQTAACRAKQFGEEGRSSLMILSGACMKRGM